MWRGTTGLFLMLALSVPASAGAKVKKPRLTLRTTPQMAMAPASVLFTAQLFDADAQEDLYCPGVQWEWGDGETSFHENDCPPFGPQAEFDSVFSGRHAYRSGGAYQVRISLVRAGRTVAATRATLLVYSRTGSLDN